MPYIFFKRKRVGEIEIRENKMAPSIKIFLNGRPNRIYRPGDEVSGKVVLTTNVQEEIKHVKVRFLGTCTTTMTRAMPGTAEESEANTSRTWSESRPLFGYDRALVTGPFTLAANEYSWDFEFKFPSCADREYQASTGRYFTRGPHKLPPSFEVSTEGRGRGSISYTIEVKLARSGFNRPDIKVSRVLHFQRETIACQPPRMLPRFIQVQSCRSKCLFDNGEEVQSPNFVSSIGKRLIWRAPLVAFAPVLYSPEAISPGQKIPLALSIRALQRRPVDIKIDSVVLTSLQVELTTYTIISCGTMLTRHPQDIMSKSVRCIDRENCSITIPANQSRVPIVSEFRLVDNNEALPTFKSYIVSRFYVLTAKMTLRWNSKTWNISCNSELGILPRCAPGQLEDVESLPLYTQEIENVPSYEEFLNQESVGSSESPTGAEDGMDLENATMSRHTTTSTDLTHGFSASSVALSDSHSDYATMHMRPRMTPEESEKQLSSEP